MNASKQAIIDILIPVYNAGDNLRTCLDSIMRQTFDDFLIIAINNGSTDNSLDILQEYKEKYPHKIQIYSIPHSNFVGVARNFAIDKAKGEYIYMCDADDMLEKDALLFLYSRAEHYKADIVYGYSRFVNTQSGTKFFSGREGEKTVSNGEAILSGADYWRRLYKKSLIDEVFEKVGKIPENTNFDDVAWLPVVHSYGKIIRSADRCIYNYFRRTVSTVGGISPKVIEYSIIAEQYAMKNCKAEYKEYAELYVARRIENNLDNRWIYKDKIIEQIKNNWKNFDANALIKKDYHLYEKLKMYYELGDNPIPKIVYINGFSDKCHTAFKEYIRENAFDQCEVIELNKNNCDIKELKKLNLKMEDAVAYFALKYIYETGGVFIDNIIKIDNPFNSLRYFDSFFGFIDKENFSDKVYGGCKGSEVIKKIYMTYQKKAYNSRRFSLSERIRNILNVYYRVPLNGETNFFEYNAAILSADVICYNAGFNKDIPNYFHLCCHAFEEKDDYEYLTIKSTSLYPLFSKGSNREGQVNMLEAHGNNISKENVFLKYRLDEIEKSLSYKLALKLSKLADLFFLKPIKRLIKEKVGEKFNN